MQFSLGAGETIIFVGANGRGKSRLTVHVENVLALDAHRISAHRALALNPDVAKISEKKALAGLRIGHPDEGSLERLNYRVTHRWGNKKSVHLLNDFDYLIQALFAEQSNTSLEAYNKVKPGATLSEDPIKVTKFDDLKRIWQTILPHRQLHISGDDILVSAPESDDRYKASEMSDGERAVFYLIGQALMAKESSVLIVDEPELHVHRSIMSKLWDEIEAERPDCGFIFITHDLEFAAVRNAQKFVIKEYSPTPYWSIEPVPEESGFDEETTSLILGSRQPILFVEGNEESLDLGIYRACYPDWTVIPRGSCSEVIHAVVTLRNNADFTRIAASGIVDGDDYEADDIANLEKLGISVLPVSEIENLFILPDVSEAIAIAEGHVEPERSTLLSKLEEAVIASLNADGKLEKVVIAYCKRRIDRALKKVDLSEASTIGQLAESYATKTAEVDIEALAEARRAAIVAAMEAQDLAALLRLYDNKELLAIAGGILKGCRRSTFEGWITRSLKNNSCPELREAISRYLPSPTEITASP